MHLDPYVVSSTSFYSSFIRIEEHRRRDSVCCISQVVLSGRKLTRNMSACTFFNALPVSVMLYNLYGSSPLISAPRSVSFSTCGDNYVGVIAINRVSRPDKVASTTYVNQQMPQTVIVLENIREVKVLHTVVRGDAQLAEFAGFAERACLRERNAAAKWERKNREAVSAKARKRLPRRPTD